MWKKKLCKRRGPVCFNFGKQCTFKIKSNVTNLTNSETTTSNSLPMPLQMLLLHHSQYHCLRKEFLWMNKTQKKKQERTKLIFGQEKKTRKTPCIPLKEKFKLFKERSTVFGCLFFWQVKHATSYVIPRPPPIEILSPSCSLTMLAAFESIYERKYAVFGCLFQTTITQQATQTLLKCVH